MGETVNSWRPIETAPAETRVLLRFAPPFSDPTETGIVVGEREGGRWWLTCIWASSNAHRSPTHWMPLPEPPEAPNA
jgi:hypothetical protein